MKRITLKILTRIPAKYIGTGFIVVILLFIYGIIGSMVIMNLNLIDSIYYSVITMATVGYGDLTPHTGAEKIFATTLALGGVGLLAYVFNIILTNVQEKMTKYSKEAKKMRAIDEMDDYYILCGYGRVGKVVFDELVERKQNVIVIDKNEESCENIPEHDNVVILNEDAIENDFISKLINEKCRSIILCTGDDVINLFIVLTIRESHPDAWIVTRASKLENVSKLKKAGADKVVSPEVIGGHDLYYESTKPHILKITVKHDVDEIYDEFKIITDHNCTLENIEYHIPGIETPLTRKIKTMSIVDGKNYRNYLNSHDDQKQALASLYKTVNHVHSHIISGPDKATFKRLIKDLEKQEEIIGINLTNEEISKLTAKNIIE
ncbi:NAD-binding protein [Methanobrevibacter sp.]